MRQAVGRMWVEPTTLGVEELGTLVRADPKPIRCAIVAEAVDVPAGDAVTRTISWLAHVGPFFHVTQLRSAGADVDATALDIKPETGDCDAWPDDFGKPAVGAPTDYAYDSDGIRQGKTGPPGTIRYLVDRISPTGYEQVVRETDASSTTLRHYVHGKSLLAQDTLSAQVYYHADSMGSVQMLSDAVGLTTVRYSYAAYGKMLRRSGTTANTYGFAGEARDDETGRIYLRARYYDEALGVFASRDPLLGDPRQPATMHRYNYAQGNPVNVVDPT